MIVVCGEALIDMVPHKIEGRGEGFYPIPGGSPCNTAIAAARLGVSVQFLGRLSGDFFGETIINRLRQNGVGTDLVVRSEENTTLAFVRFDRGKEPAYIFYAEGTADRSLSPEDLPPELPRETRCLVFGSIAMTMEPVASAIETLVFRTARTSPCVSPVISFDPNIRPFMIRDRNAYMRRFEKWAAAATIVKISTADFEFIYPGMDPAAARQKVLALGPRLVITTLGAEGALALLRRDAGDIAKARAPAVDMPVADTIGAGDTFHGAFLSWLEMKGNMSPQKIAALGPEELREGLYFANKTASIVCSRHGADPPSLEEVEKL
jgi:fructokinase